jgi:hypothetical protein
MGKMMMQIGGELKEIEVSDTPTVHHYQPLLSVEEKLRSRKLQCDSMIAAVYGPQAWRVVSYHSRLNALLNSGAGLSDEQRADLAVLNAGDVWQEKLISSVNNIDEAWATPPAGLAELCAVC